MPEFNIPPEATTGFQSIIDLSTESAKDIATFLANSEISSDINELYKGLDNFIKSTLKIEKSKSIVSAIASFAPLMDGDNYEEISESLALSFKDSISPEISVSDFSSLKGNLKSILKALDNVQLSIKAFKLKTESFNIYTKSKIITDVRIIFNKEIDKKSRKAVLVHNLHLKYNSNSETKNFFISLDLIDLKELQEQIERAISKEETIRNDYNFELI